VAGTMATGRGRARTIAAINVTPLVDVVLVLLVILMVASTYIVAQTLKVQLPRAMRGVTTMKMMRSTRQTSTSGVMLISLRTASSVGFLPTPCRCARTFFFLSPPLPAMGQLRPSRSTKSTNSDETSFMSTTIDSTRVV